MKKYLVVLAAMMMVIAMVSGAFAATTTTSVTSTATVAFKCNVGGTPAVSFNTIDALTPGPYSGSVTNPTLYCTSAGTITVADNGGLYNSSGKRLSDGTNFIPYTLTYNSPLTGQGRAVDIGGSGSGNLALAASIADHAIDSSPAGAYTDTVIITITY
jgi:spore coat protein U-like protein